MNSAPFVSFVQKFAEIEAQRFGVLPAIHPNDYMYRFLLTMNGGSDEIATKQYFEGGHNDSSQLLKIIGEINPRDHGKSVLEFASGYGRMTRHIVKQLVATNFVSVDIHPEAVDFLKTHLGINSMQSASRPDQLQISSQFDFVFALSLFSHLPESSFSHWLAAIYNLTSPGGRFLFTTHGEAAMQKVEFLKNRYNAITGFGYQESSEQGDLDTNEYGTTVCSAGYVISSIHKTTNARIISYKPGCWFGLQDEWILERPL